MNDDGLWDELALAFLHDPPDKAFDIVHHVSRAAKHASALLGTEITSADIEAQQIADAKAASEDRLPVPDAHRGGRYDESRTVLFGSRDAVEEPGLVRHPVSGEALRLEIPEFERGGLDQLEPFRRFAEAVSGLAPKPRFFALWRWYPTVVGACHPELRLLPADTRVPDHTIWNHLDLAAAFAAAQRAAGGPALLSFTIGPVQSFISQAKSLRDLWSGSYLLSWLTFAAIEALIDELGPTAIVFPSLRGNPICDHRRPARLGPDVGRAIGLDEPADPVNGSLPNTFLAVVPAREADEWRGRAEAACRAEWKKICEAVRTCIAKRWEPPEDWDRGWAEQTERFWDVRTVAWPLDAGGKGTAESLKAAFREWLGAEWPPPVLAPLDEVVKRTAEPGRTVYPSRPSWSLHVEMVGRLMEAAKLIRQVPPHAAVDDARFKCTLMGTFEQMGPAEKEAADPFWEKAVSRPIEGTHVRPGERLGAVGLVKRFCWPAYFAGELGIRPSDLRFLDTATVAARPWLDKHGIEPVGADGRSWSGHWVFQVTTGRMPPDEDEKVPPAVQSRLEECVRKDRRAKEELPRPYYAALALDGDEMGRWLRGEKAKTLRDAYHPKMVRLFEEGAGAAPATVRDALGSLRPVTPAMHAAISSALADFSLGLVPGIVEEALGELVYAGGDDVLALLPVRNAVSCGYELQRAFRGENADGLPTGWCRRPGRDGVASPADDRPILTLMGATASASAGIAVAHFKDDLRNVLAAARDAEKAAKNAGRNALGIAVLKRSGEHRTVVMKWSWVPTFQAFVEAFRAGASDRWVHALHGDLPVLEPPGAGVATDLHESLPVEAIEAEMGRVVARADRPTRETLASCLPDGADSDPDADTAAERRVVKAWRGLRECMDEAAADGNGRGEGPLSRFLGLLSAASFVARGGEE